MRYFSIIIPAYNVGKYIEDCLDSILRQSFTDYEIIIVDDESTDDTYEIVCKKVAQNDNIKAIRITHENVGVVRNKAIELAEGKYLVFVDADDLIEPDTLLSIHDCYEKGNVDICYMPIHYVLTNDGKNKNELIKNLNDDFYFFNNSDEFFSFVAGKHGVVPGAMWTQSCRRQMVVDNRIQFVEEFVWSQDGDFCFQTLKASHGIAVCSYPGYVWNRLNVLSATQSVTSKKIISRLNVYKKWYDEFKSGLFGKLSDDNRMYLMDYFLRNYYEVLKSYAFLKDPIERKKVENVLEEQNLLKEKTSLIPKEFKIYGIRKGRIIFLMHFYFGGIMRRLKNM